MRGATVRVYADAPVSGILPPPGYSDNEGLYSLEYPALGMAFLSASKLSDGYPDLELALYGRGNYGSVRRIDLEPDRDLKNVDLRFAEPFTRLAFVIKDADSGTAIEHAGILVHWAASPRDRKDDVNAMTTSTVDLSGIYHLLLPKHALSITITAPGYVSWTHRDRGSGAYYLQFAGKKEAEVDVRLRSERKRRVRPRVS